MSNTIRTVLFDMGNVLVHFSHDLMYRQIGDVCDVEPDTIRGWLEQTGLLADFERGRVSEAELHAAIEARLGRVLPTAELLRAASDIFKLNAPIVPVLDSLRHRGYRLVLLSNTSVSHFNWIRREFDVLDRFDALITSYEAGAIKPEPPIYEAALTVINCDPGDCFYTDDIPAYVEAGRQFGLQAEVFTGVEELREHLAARGVWI